MNFSEQFWLSVAVQAIFGVAVLAMMKQQLRDMVGWTKQNSKDIDELQKSHTNHEGRIAHVEGHLRLPRGGE